VFPTSSCRGTLSLFKFDNIIFHIFKFCISQTSQKSCKCIEASPLVVATNCSLVIRFNKPGLTSKLSIVISGVLIGLAIKWTIGLFV
jgi:hypothetical protein